MLQKLHDNIKGWVASVIIGLICLAFVLWGVQSYVSGEASQGKTLVTVAGKKITDKEVNQLYQQLVRQVSANHGPLTSQMRDQLKAMALDRLVAQVSLSEAAKKSGFYVGKSQALQLIMAIPQFQNQGRFSQQLFQQFIYANRLTQNQFISEIKTEMLINQVAFGIQNSSFVLPSDLKNYYDLIYQQRSFSYLVIPFEKFIPQIEVTDEEVKNYYKNNQDQFRQPAMVSISYLKLSPQEIAKNIKIKEKDLQQYYQTNIANYRIPATWKIERITVPLSSKANSAQVAASRAKMKMLLNQIKKGVKFDELIQHENGVTETINEGKASNVLLTVVKTLKPNQISNPFNMPDGYTIIRLVSHTQSKTKPFEKVKDSVKAMLANQKAQQIITNMSDQLANLTYTNPTSLKPAALALNLKIIESPFFSRNGTKSGISSFPNVVEAAFSQDILQDGNNSSPIILKDGSIVVLRAKNHINSKIKPFKEVENEIITNLKNKTAQANATLFAQKLQSELQKGATPEALTEQQNLMWKNENNIVRKDETIPSAILQAAFNLSFNKKITTVAMKDGNIAIVMLNKITAPDFSYVSDNEKKELLNKLQQFFGALTYQLYASGVKKSISIKYTQST